ncbi:MAG TPA: hypothetical protein VGZ22_08825 [Isosphaeraceae bacterium]|nr:hypothetical protein [Isosphaeraceae bacterium]
MRRHAIRQTLREHGIELVCHMTPFHKLPSIFGRGAILSSAARRAARIADEPGGHYWGSADKKEALKDFVVCSVQPPWSMCRNHDEEMAMVLLNAAEVCSMAGACFCPGNTAYSAFTATDIRAMNGPAALEQCLDPVAINFAEILVYERIPMDRYEVIAFCDDTARRYWSRRLRSVTRPGLGRSEGPDPVDDYLRFRFPPDWKPTRRIR